MQTLDGRGDARAASLRPDDSQRLEQPGDWVRPVTAAHRHEEAAGFQPERVGQGPEARFTRLLIVEIDLGRVRRPPRALATPPPASPSWEPGGRDHVRLQLGLKEIRHQFRRFRQRLETIFEQRHDRPDPLEIGMTWVRRALARSVRLCQERHHPQCKILDCQHMVDVLLVEPAQLVVIERSRRGVDPLQGKRLEQIVPAEHLGSAVETPPSSAR